MTPAEADTQKDKPEDKPEKAGKGYRTSAEIDKGNKQDVERTRKEAAENG